MNQQSPPTPTYLAEILNRSVASELDSIAPTEWDENHISFLLVRAMRNTLQKTSTFQTQKTDSLEHSLHIQAEAYKVTGEIERTHGDIVIAITHIIDGRPLTGLGFYEAKAAGLDYRYPAFKMRQLQRLTSSTPRLSLLLYERSEMAVTDDDFPMIFPNQYNRQNNSQRVRVLGANLASRFSEPNYVSMYAQSFGHHFVTRYLSGRDLDYSRKPAESLQHWLKVTKRAPPLLVSIVLSNRDAEPPIPLLPEYSPIPVLQIGGSIDRPMLP
jgi:hypothetical protein